MKQPKSTTFNEDPYALGFRIRDVLLEDVDNGFNPVADELIPFFEREAARVLRESEALIDCSGEPDRRKNSESWRLWWMNEVHHLSNHNFPTPQSEYSLPETTQHAINVLLSASELRSAMDSKDVERTALFMALMTMEIIQGGYCLDAESAKRGLEVREKKGIGKINAKYKRLAGQCIELAKKQWNDDPSMRIGQVVQAILNKIFLAAANDKRIPIPEDETIKGWLIAAEKDGELTIPATARKGGRPKNK